MNYIFYNNQGKIKNTISCPEDLFQYQTIPEDCKFLQLEQAPPNIYDYYVENDLLTSLPEKPNDYSIFNYETKQWVPNESYCEYQVKKKRSELLKDSDWTDTTSAPTRLGSELYNQWQTYRQALRDVTVQSGYPCNVTWPTPPQ